MGVKVLLIIESLRGVAVPIELGGRVTVLCPVGTRNLRTNILVRVLVVPRLTSLRGEELLAGDCIDHCLLLLMMMMMLQLSRMLLLLVQLLVVLQLSVLLDFVLILLLIILRPREAPLAAVLRSKLRIIVVLLAAGIIILGVLVVGVFPGVIFGPGCHAHVAVRVVFIASGRGLKQLDVDVLLVVEVIFVEVAQFHIPSLDTRRPLRLALELLLEELRGLVNPLLMRVFRLFVLPDLLLLLLCGLLLRTGLWRRLIYGRASFRLLIFILRLRRLLGRGGSILLELGLLLGAFSAFIRQGGLMVGPLAGRREVCHLRLLKLLFT